MTVRELREALERVPYFLQDCIVVDEEDGHELEALSVLMRVADHGRGPEAFVYLTGWVAADTPLLLASVRDE